MPGQLDGAADLEIFNQRRQVEGGIHQYFRLRAKEPELGVHNLEFRSEHPLQDDPYAKISEVYREFESWRLFNHRDKEIAIARIAAKGVALYKDLIPPGMQDLLWQLQGRVVTIQIESEDDHWIPWELLKLQTRQNGVWRQGPFLCEAFAISRWLPGTSLKTRLSLRNMAVVAAEGAELDGAAREVSCLLLLADQERSVTRLAARYPEVTAAMEGGLYDGWHFAGHSSKPGGGLGPPVIELDGDDHLTPDDLTGTRGNLGRPHPLVFLNTCRSAQEAPWLVNVIGWAQQFLGVDAGAFVGTRWAVYDWAAESFCRAFYRELLAGVPFALALNAAREAVRVEFPGDPSYLAYVGFGHPLAAVGGGTRRVAPPDTPPPPQIAANRDMASDNRQIDMLRDEIRELELDIEGRSLRGDAVEESRSKLLELKRALLHSGVGISLNQGSLLNDRFKLGEVLGAGGFGTVWKAYDRRTQQTVAVKVLHGQWSRDLSRHARFFRGARKMANLSHPNIVRVIEEEMEYMGNSYFVMEYLPGGDLEQAVREGRLFPDEAASMILEIGYALQYAHEKDSLVHRDIKPSNVLLDGQGRAKLSDFDLVRAPDTTGATRTGGLGSFMYMAPEALDLAKAALPSADLFSLAMTLVYCLHGRELPMSAFRMPSHFVLTLDLDDSVKAALLNALHWNPQRRFPDVLSFCRALEQVMPLPSAGGGLMASEERKALHRRIAGRAVPTPHRPALARIPAGSFHMGSPEDEPGRFPDEELRQVVIPSPFWMSSTPITQTQYSTLMGGNPSYFQAARSGGSHNPVEQVSWFDAARYCNALSAQEGFASFYVFGYASRVEHDPSADGYRLPTESQWEYACRAGSQTRFWNGDTEDDLAATGWIYPEAGGRTREVAKRLGNSWGLYDLHGNVWEWCADDLAGRKVIRGGSHFLSGDWARSASRSRRHPEEKDQFLGFRIVRPIQSPGDESEGEKWPPVKSNEPTTNGGKS